MNSKQRDTLLALAKPGDLIYITGKGFISKLVVFGQGQLDKTWTNGLSHVTFVDMYNQVCESSIELHFEKTNKFPFFKIDYSSGVHVTPIDKWSFDGKEELYLIVQRLDGITADDIKKASEVAYRLQQKKMHYSVLELFGTLIAYLNYSFAGLFKIFGKDWVHKWQEQILEKHNPIDEGDKGMYCIAFANHCWETGTGKRLIPDDINEEVCNVGDGLRNKLGYTMTIISPEGKPIYVKKPKDDFNYKL